MLALQPRAPSAPPPATWGIPRDVDVPRRTREELLGLAGGLVRGAYAMLGLAERLMAAAHRDLAVDCLGHALELARAASKLRRIARGLR